MSNSGIDNLRMIIDKHQEESLNSESQKLPLDSSTSTSIDNKKLSQSNKYSLKCPFNSVHKFFINYY